MPHSNLARIFALLFLVCCGCAEKTPPAPSAASAANVQPVPPPELAIEDLPEFKIPGGRLQVPEWAGKRADEPFPVREYVEELLERQSDGERWYLAGLGRLHSELADCAITRKEELDSSVEQLESLLERIHPEALSTRNVIRYEENSAAIAAEILRAISPTISAVDRAQRFDTSLFETDLTMTQNKVHMRACLRLAQLMNLQIHASMKDHDFSAIDRAVQRTLRLSRDLRPGSSDVGVTVGYRIELLTLNSLQDCVLHTSVWTGEEYAQIQQRIRHHNQQTRDAFERVAREAYLMTGNSLWALERGTVSPEQLDIGVRAEELMDLVNYPAEWRALNQIYGWIISDYIAAPIDTTEVADEFDRRFDHLKDNTPRDARKAGLVDGKLATPFVYLLLFPGLNQLRDAFAVRQVAIGIMDIALQMRRFEMAHERTPTTLGELFSGDGEAGLPIDPYSGEPLKYRLLEDLAVIYSVGKDRIDQGGAEQWDENRQSGDVSYKIYRLYGQ